MAEDHSDGPPVRDPLDTLVMYVILRDDLRKTLSWPTGALVAQGAHGAGRRDSLARPRPRETASSVATDAALLSGNPSPAQLLPQCCGSIGTTSSCGSTWRTSTGEAARSVAACRRSRRCRAWPKADVCRSSLRGPRPFDQRLMPAVAACRMHKVVLAAGHDEELRAVSTSLTAASIAHKLWVRTRCVSAEGSPVLILYACVRHRLNSPRALRHASPPRFDSAAYPRSDVAPPTTPAPCTPVCAALPQAGSGQFA